MFKHRNFPENSVNSKSFLKLVNITEAVIYCSNLANFRCNKLLSTERCYSENFAGKLLFVERLLQRTFRRQTSFRGIVCYSEHFADKLLSAESKLIISNINTVRCNYERNVCVTDKCYFPAHDIIFRITTVSRELSVRSLTESC